MWNTTHFPNRIVFPILRLRQLTQCVPQYAYSPLSMLKNRENGSADMHVLVSIIAMDSRENVKVCSSVCTSVPCVVVPMRVHTWLTRAKSVRMDINFIWWQWSWTEHRVSTWVPLRYCGSTQCVKYNTRYTVEQYCSTIQKGVNNVVKSSGWAPCDVLFTPWFSDLCQVPDTREW